MMDGEGDFFPEIQPECSRALLSIKAPELLALVQLCELLACFFSDNGKRAGRSAVVDAARLFGGQFSNNARRIIGAAARVRSDIWLPASLTRADAVRTARQLLAKRLLPAWTKAGELLARIARGEE